jgi:hypothetical protein
MDTYEFTVPGGSAIITTTTGGTKEAPDFCVFGGGRKVSVFAAEILRLAGRLHRLELVAGEIISRVAHLGEDADPLTIAAELGAALKGEE